MNGFLVGRESKKVLFQDKIFFMNGFKVLVLHLIWNKSWVILSTNQDTRGTDDSTREDIRRIVPRQFNPWTSRRSINLIRLCPRTHEVIKVSTQLTYCLAANNFLIQFEFWLEMFQNCQNWFFWRELFCSQNFNPIEFWCWLVASMNGLIQSP